MIYDGTMIPLKSFGIGAKEMQNKRKGNEKMTKNKKTFDDMNEDPRFLTIQKKCLETQIQKVMEWDLDELFKHYWKGCPKKLKEYIYSYDSSDDYYCCATDYVNEFLLSECSVTEKMYESIITWLEGLKILVFWPQR